MGIYTAPHIQDAIDYFREAHDSINHRRKYTNEPYWHHTEEVARLVSTVTDDTDMFIAALGHDCLEDVCPLNPKYSFDAILHRFGARAAFMIQQLTDKYTKVDYPELNRVQRKLKERERMRHIWQESKTIKAADLISNLLSISSYDKNFCVIFVKEINLLLPYIGEADYRLLDMLREHIDIFTI